jgi:hypothetical protein
MHAGFEGLLPAGLIWIKGNGSIMAPSSLTELTRQSRSVIMAMQIVMDHSGDTRHYFDPDDAEALAKAEERFNRLTGHGFTAAVRNASGEVVKINSFNPTAEETVFFPRLIGG